MRTVGVIAEFNPFHKGHKYLFDAIRAELDPDGIVCVMSGDFVQRGCPALSDKWTRAKAAVCEGADLVLELPTVFALSAAPDFAFGAVKILDQLGCVSDLAFGSESGDLTELEAIAKINTENDPALKAALKEGLSYPVALARAIGRDLEPNDILAVEYLRACGSLKPHAVKRRGMGHRVSASYIREHLAEIENFVPEDALYELQGASLWDSAADEKLYNMLRYALIMKPAYELADIMGVSEGLENALKKAVDGALSLEDIIMNAKSKRYSYARISRALMCIALDMWKFLIEEAKGGPLYARVLALSETGAAILKEAKASSEIDIISKLKKTELLCAPYKDIIETDIQASDLYSILTGRDVRSYSDFARGPRLETAGFEGYNV